MKKDDYKLVPTKEVLEIRDEETTVYKSVLNKRKKNVKYAIKFVFFLKKREFYLKLSSIKGRITFRRKFLQRKKLASLNW